MIRLLAIDVDGTLLNSKKELTAGTRRALELATNAGIHPVIATGRMKTELQPLREQLPMVRYVITCTGAEVLDLQTGETISRDPISAEEMRRLYEKLAGLDILHQVFSEHDGRIHNSAAAVDRLAHYTTPALEKSFRGTHVLERDLDAFVAAYTGSVNKMHMYFGSVADREEAQRRLSGLPYEILSSEEKDLEIMAPGVDKAHGLRQLAQKLGIRQEETAAIGDGDNDAAMLRWAGLGIAMGNASAAARGAADLETADCDHEGLAKAVTEILQRDPYEKQAENIKGKMQIGF